MPQTAIDQTVTFDALVKEPDWLQLLNNLNDAEKKLVAKALLKKIIAVAASEHYHLCAQSDNKEEKARKERILEKICFFIKTTIHDSDEKKQANLDELLDKKVQGFFNSIKPLTKEEVATEIEQCTKWQPSIKTDLLLNGVIQLAAKEGIRFSEKPNVLIEKLIDEITKKIPELKEDGSNTNELALAIFKECLPISPARTQKSLEELQDAIKKHFSLLTPSAHRLLARQILQPLNSIAADIKITLSESGDEIVEKVIKAIIEKAKEQTETNLSKNEAFSIAEVIFTTVFLKAMKKDTEKQQQSTQGRGFGNSPLHESVKRNSRLWLVENHIDTLLPKECSKENGDNALKSSRIKIFAASTFEFDNSLDSFKTALIDAINDAAIHYIILPINVGDNHWCSIYFEKTDKGLEVELFDPMGTDESSFMDSLFSQKNTNKLKNGIKKILDDKIIKKTEFKIASAEKKQQDGYACGDFVLAYSHKKTKEWYQKDGLLRTSYNGQPPYEESLISTLEEKGNEGNALRKATCCYSAKLNGVDNYMPPNTLNNMSPSFLDGLLLFSGRDDCKSRSRGRTGTNKLSVLYANGASIFDDLPDDDDDDDDEEEDTSQVADGNPPIETEVDVLAALRTARLAAEKQSETPQQIIPKRPTTPPPLSTAQLQLQQLAAAPAPKTTGTTTAITPFWPPATKQCTVKKNEPKPPTSPALDTAL